ncbi:MAG: hypothetical protein L3J63_06830 [Geopsychrobacter sp.]|nr:hypothetical protein [Geopsychrobacter sp.]
MAESAHNECKDPAGHYKHVCQLKKDGKQQEIAALVDDPGHICLNCTAVANNALNLCSPSPFSRA